MVNYMNQTAVNFNQTVGNATGIGMQGTTGLISPNNAPYGGIRVNNKRKLYGNMLMVA
jgi:hypothetical protein